MAEQDNPSSTRGWKPGFIATLPCNFPTNIKHPLETVEYGIYSTVFIWEPNNGNVHTTGKK